MKDLTCPLHGTSLIKQALRHRPLRRARGSIKIMLSAVGKGRGIKTTPFSTCIRVRERILLREKTARPSIYNYIYTYNEIYRPVVVHLFR